MKRLILIRHGKAEDITFGISDFERSLTLKGKTFSRFMARRLREKGIAPGLVMSSPAFRALETALIFAIEFGINADDIILNNDIYSNMNLQNLHTALAAITEDVETVALFGHNPSFSQIADTLCKEGCDLLPKTGIAVISFKIKSWSGISRNNGILEYFLKP